MPPRAEDPWYDADHEVRRVRSNGEIKWKGEFVFIGEALVDELVGIAERETGDYVVRFCDLDIGLIGPSRAIHPVRLRRVRGLHEPAEQPA